jgi:hypothetical protein
VSRALVTGAMLWALGSELWPQSPKPTAQSGVEAQSGLQVYLITIGQGDLYFEKYGHNMLWFHDPARNIDVAYNWGMFDFRAPGFLRRQLIGDPMYSVVGFSGNAMIEEYKGRDRTIVLQRLNFTPLQANKAFEYARWNARDENKFYRYDYYRDNCSTRVRDVIDLALGGALKNLATGSREDWSYHSETARLLDELKLTQFGVNVALGRPADRPLTVWEGMFIPMRLRDAIRAITLADTNGVMQPLVAEERTIYESRSHHERADAPRLSVPYLIIGLLLAVQLLVLGHVGSRAPAAETAFRFEVGLWALVTGILGLIVLLGWMITEHVFWYRNENLLLLNPLSLFLAVLAPLSLRRTRWLRPAAICAVIVAMLAVIAAIFKGLPNAQDNVPLILSLLPPHFAVAFGLWTRAKARAPEPT